MITERVGDLLSEPDLTHIAHQSQARIAALAFPPSPAPWKCACGWGGPASGLRQGENNTCPKCGGSGGLILASTPAPVESKPKPCGCQRHEENGHYRTDCPHYKGVCVAHGKSNCGTCDFDKDAKWSTPAADTAKPSPEKL